MSSLKSKLILDFPTRELTEQGLVWRNSWISKYESPWGILEKFKYANDATDRDILELLGTDHVKKLKTKNYSNRNRDLVHLTGICNEECNKTLGFPLKEEHLNNLGLLVGFISLDLNNINNYLRGEVTICPLCIQEGFHSLFHQWKLIQVCPYHLVPLIPHCPNCKRGIPYLLSDKEMKAPFTCLCGYTFIKNNTIFQYFARWDNNIKRSIHLSALKRWLSLNDKQREQLKWIHFHPDSAEENMDSLLNRLLLVIESSKNNCTQLKVVRSASYLDSLFELAEEEEEQARYHYQEIQFRRFLDEVYSSSYAILKSVTRQFRKTIFMKHRTCIRRLVKLDKTSEVCPYAYAYVAWQKNIYDYQNYWQVDRRYYPDRWYRNRIEFASKQDMRYLQQLFFDWQKIDYVMKIPNAKSSTTKWVFNRIMSMLVINHLKNWLRIAQENVREGNLSWYAPFEYERIPFYIIQFNKFKNEPLKFYWWPESTQETIELTCPFDTKKKGEIISMKTLYMVKPQWKLL